MFSYSYPQPSSQRQLPGAYFPNSQPQYFQQPQHDDPRERYLAALVEAELAKAQYLAILAEQRAAEQRLQEERENALRRFFVQDAILAPRESSYNVSPFVSRERQPQLQGQFALLHEREAATRLPREQEVVRFVREREATRLAKERERERSRRHALRIRSERERRDAQYRQYADVVRGLVQLKTSEFVPQAQTAAQPIFEPALKQTVSQQRQIPQPALKQTVSQQQRQIPQPNHPVYVRFSFQPESEQEIPAADLHRVPRVRPIRPEPAPSSAPAVPAPSETPIGLALTKIMRIDSRLAALESQFTFPSEVDFELPSSKPEGPKPILSYTSKNGPIRAHEHALGQLLTQLDSIDSAGSAFVRMKRKVVVEKIESALESLDRVIGGRWNIFLDKAGAKTAPVSANAETEASSSTVPVVVEQGADALTVKNSEQAAETEPRVEADATTSTPADEVEQATSCADIINDSPAAVNDSPTAAVNDSPTAAVNDSPAAVNTETISPPIEDNSVTELDASDITITAHISTPVPAVAIQETAESEEQEERLPEAPGITTTAIQPAADESIVVENDEIDVREAAQPQLPEASDLSKHTTSPAADELLVINVKNEQADIEASAQPEERQEGESLSLSFNIQAQEASSESESEELSDADSDTFLLEDSSAAPTVRTAVDSDNDGVLVDKDAESEGAGSDWSEL